MGDIPLSRIMQNIGFRYTHFIHRKYQRAGHLFQGHYKALMIDADSYLLALIRYIHLNPLRARMVIHPEEYPWSSHPSYLGIVPGPPWLSTDWALARFAGQAAVLCFFAVHAWRMANCCVAAKTIYTFCKN